MAAVPVQNKQILKQNQRKTPDTVAVTLALNREALRCYALPIGDPGVTTVKK